MTNRLLTTLAAIWLLLLGEARSDPDDPVVFVGQGLDWVVQNELSEIGVFVDGPITEGHMAQLTRFRCCIHGTFPVDTSDLTGFEFATNLEEIELDTVVDISALAGLAKLTSFTASGGPGINQIGTLTALKKLDIRGFTTGVELQNIGTLTQLEELTIRASTLEPFNGLTELRILNVSNGTATDLSPVAGMTKLEELYATANQIESIPALPNLTALRKFYISNTGLMDISGLSSLPSLEEFGAINNQISDVSVITGLTNLETLRLDGNLIASLPALGALDELETLSLSDNLLTDTDGIAGMLKLDSLSLSENLIDDLGGLSDLPSLLSLSLRDNLLTDISPLNQFATLDFLDVAENGLTSLPVFTLPVIRFLRIEKNALTDLSPLSSLGSLESVNASNNQIGSIPDFTGFVPSGWLNLSANQLDLTPGEPAQVKVDELRARNVVVSTWEQTNPDPLFDNPDLEDELRDALNKPVGFLSTEDMESLVSFDPGDRLLPSFDGLELATNLANLTLRNQWLDDISFLADLTSLRSLDLYNNLIEDISPLAALTNLESVDLRDNKIRDPEPLAGLNSLQLVVFDDNAINLDPASAPGAVINALDLRGVVVEATDQVFPVALFEDPAVEQAVRVRLAPAPKNIPLADMLGVERLRAYGGEITSLAGLESAANLRELQLGNNAVTDLSPLAGLTALQVLALDLNPALQDISALAGNSALRFLDLSGTAVDDLTPLVGLANLQHLLLLEPDAQALAQVPQLEAQGVEVYHDQALQLAAAGSIAFTEVHYFPAEPNAAELDAGFEQNNDFEFLEIMNITDEVVDLTELRFWDGVDFHFLDGSSLLKIPPGFRLLLVNNRDAFQMRYGDLYQVAGEYDGRLENDGERLGIYDFDSIINGPGLNMRVLELIYRPTFPWPEEAAGAGRSLVLRAPLGGEEYAYYDAADWRASLEIHGNPGTSDAFDFASWQVQEFGPAANDPQVAGLEADPDGDGDRNEVEYAIGSDPNDPKDGLSNRFRSRLVNYQPDLEEPPELILEVSITRNPAADSVALRAQQSTDLQEWMPGGLEPYRLPQVGQEGGAPRHFFRSTQIDDPDDPAVPTFFRFQFESR